MKMLKYFIISIALLFASPSFAADLFRVRNLEINSTAESASSAKNSVILEAKRRAFDRIIKRIAITDDENLFSDLSDKEIERAVRSFRISNEKLTKVAYRASIDVLFSKDLIIELLKLNNVEYVLSRGSPVLLIPVYESEGNIHILFENPLLKKLTEFDLENNTATIFLPTPNMEDNLSLEILKSGNKVNFAPIITGLGVNDVYILWADNEGDATSFKLEKVGVGNIFEGEIKNIISEKSSDEKVTDHSRIIELAVDNINVYAKTEAMKKVATGGEEATLLIPLSSLASWSRLYNRLDKLDFIKTLELQAMRQSVAQVKVTFELTLDAFQKEMEKSLFSISEKDSGVFILDVT